MILDLGMPDATVQKVNETFSALEGAFSQYDEVALYTYSSAGSQSGRISARWASVWMRPEQLKYVTGPTTDRRRWMARMGPRGPVINGIPSIPVRHDDPDAYRQESHVLNDAILQARST